MGERQIGTPQEVLMTKSLVTEALIDKGVEAISLQPDLAGYGMIVETLAEQVLADVSKRRSVADRIILHDLLKLVAQLGPEAIKPALARIDRLVPASAR
jgi:hypothetical protein